MTSFHQIATDLHIALLAARDALARARGLPRSRILAVAAVLKKSGALSPTITPPPRNTELGRVAADTAALLREAATVILAWLETGSSISDRKTIEALEHTFGSGRMRIAVADYRRLDRLDRVQS